MSQFQFINKKLIFYFAKKSITKNYSYWMQKEKVNEQRQIRTNKRKLHNTIVAVILYTKYDLSILNSYGDIFDKNVERKNMDIYKEEQEVHSRSHNTTHCPCEYQVSTF